MGTTPSHVTGLSESCACGLSHAVCGYYDGDNGHKFNVANSGGRGFAEVILATILLSSWQKPHHLFSFTFDENSKEQSW